MKRRWGVLLVLLMVVSGLAGWWSADWKAQRTGGPTVQTAYLLDNGFHTDLAVPRDLVLTLDDVLGQAALQLLAAYPDAQWFLVGWGDQSFYQASGPVRERLPDGARALFTPGGSPAVLQIIALEAHPQRLWRDEAYRVDLDAEGAARLRARIARTLAEDDGGGPRRAGTRAVYRPDDTLYFDSDERFSVFSLCNHWMASVLHAGGLDMPVGRAMISAEVVRAVQRVDEGSTGLARPQ